MEAGTATTGSSVKERSDQQQVLDGSSIMELVENDEAFSSFVDHKFKELDKDNDGQLSVKELKPAVADIGAALGLPLQGSSPVSDNIYSEVLNEFTHGQQEKVSKTEFKEVLSDILIGMAAGLKRDPVVILRIEGEDLLEFIDGPSYDAEMVSIFSHLGCSDDASLLDCIVKAFGKLTVDQGMPPSSDSWVMSNIVEPALKSWDGYDQGVPVSKLTFLEEFKKVAKHVARNLKEQPVIVAHSENTFDGSGIKILLSNKFELDKSLNVALGNVPKDRHGKIPTGYLHVLLDAVAPSAGLPPIGAVEQVDKIVADVFRTMHADEGKMVKEDEFKKLLTEILWTIMLQLQDNPIAVSSNCVVHEPLESFSSILQP
ncbi:CALCIUM SENSOR [Hibiscus trionum]|uniref:CALCIUM SENSOR n=1 Tax=Hibiscus trionum TaxID=183268 RepID=A0A9W7M0W6_HIBTR|nr:CALCIUM SENSOR [Hibiscus trionum]